MQETTSPTLEQQRADFASRRLIAMPLAGTIAWLAVAAASLFVTSKPALCLILFAATGSIAYLGMFLSKFTGENFLDKTRPKNTFDTLFFYTVGEAILVYAIAIPFFLVDYSSLPLTVGILTGLMWLPMTWIIQHWIGLFHGIARTAGVVAAWYLFPQQRFFVIPMVIVAVYAVTIAVLERRWRAGLSGASLAASTGAQA